MQEIDVDEIANEVAKDIKAIKSLFSCSVFLNNTQLLLPLPGLYLVAVDGECDMTDLKQIIYIGMSTNIKERWANHHKMPILKTIDKALNKHPKATNLSSNGLNLSQLRINCWYNPFILSAQLLEIESTLIRVIKPLLNERVSTNGAKTLPIILPING